MAMLDLRALEEELRRLRSEGPPDGESAGRYIDVRMVVLNLVVVTFQERLASEAAEMLATLASHYPSRALIIHATPEGGGVGLEARLAAHCQWSPGGTRQICGEQVFLRARGPLVDHLPSIVTPLLLSDLPVVVWWLGVPRLDAAVFEQMVDLGDTLLIDSDTFPAPAGTLRRLLKVTGRAARGCAVSDLAWMRLDAWRELAAHSFDGRLAACLGTMQEATVEHGGHDAPAQAVLAAGWLRAQLGQNLPVRLQAVAGPAGLRALRLRALDRRRPVHCTLERRGDTIVVETRGGFASTRTVLLPAPAGTDLVARALAQHGPDPVYERAVGHAPAP